MITAVPGLRVGHWTDPVALTGCTVVLCPPGTVGSGEVRGGAPGTRETDLLRPGTLVQEVHAVLLTGGSAFGLAAATGVQRWLEERGIGFETPVARVPVVPAAVLFDLGIGDASARPDDGAGYAACEAATDRPVEEGSVGAGTGATFAKQPDPAACWKGGLGNATVEEGDRVVAALVVVNALGTVLGEDGEPVAENRNPDAEPRPWPGTNTTLVVVATNARLTKDRAQLLAQSGSEGVSTVVLDRLGPGGQAGASSRIENFIGFPNGLSGNELATRGVLQMLKFGARMVAPVVVDRIDSADGPNGFHTLHLDCGTQLRARTILAATGVRWRQLDVEGAEQFESAGVHHACTSVEAALYDNQDVAVVGAGNSAGQAAMFLAECCRTRTVHLLVRRRLGKDMSDYLVGRIHAAPNIVVHEGVEVASVHGERRLEGVSLQAFNANRDEPANQRNGTETLPVSAVFVFIGAEPGGEWLPDGVARDPLGYVLTGVDALKSGRWPLTTREPCPLETTVPGILAAGDIRSGSTKRVGFAVGDGSLAVTCVHKLTAIRQ